MNEELEEFLDHIDIYTNGKIKPWEVVWR